MVEVHRALDAVGGPTARLGQWPRRLSALVVKVGLDRRLVWRNCEPHSNLSDRPGKHQLPVRVNDEMLLHLVEHNPAARPIFVLECPHDRPERRILIFDIPPTAPRLRNARRRKSESRHRARRPQANIPPSAVEPLSPALHLLRDLTGLADRNSSSEGDIPSEVIDLTTCHRHCRHPWRYIVVARIVDGSSEDTELTRVRRIARQERIDVRTALDPVDVFHSLANERLALPADPAAVFLFGCRRLDHRAHPRLPAFVC